MKTTIARLTTALVVVLLAGCATPPHRARQYNEAYKALPEETQERVLDRTIHNGDSPVAVYVALGPPQSYQNTENTYGQPEAHWLYLGHPIESEDEPPTPGSYRFETVNDLTWGNPFGKTENQRIRVIFVNQQLERVELEEDDGRAVVRPEMVMPEL